MGRRTEHDEQVQPDQLRVQEGLLYESHVCRRHRQWAARVGIPNLLDPLAEVATERDVELVLLTALVALVLSPPDDRVGELVAPGVPRPDVELGHGLDVVGVLVAVLRLVAADPPLVEVHQRDAAVAVLHVLVGCVIVSGLRGVISQKAQQRHCLLL